MFIILGVGTNLGNRQLNCKNALDLLQTRVFLGAMTCSKIIESIALLTENAPKSWDLPYLNMAAGGNSNLKPLELLREIQLIERQLGREPSERWAPRIIDIDILLYGDQKIQSDELTIPHIGLFQDEWREIRYQLCIEVNELAGSPLVITKEKIVISEKSTHKDKQKNK